MPADRLRAMDPDGPDRPIPVAQLVDAVGAWAGTSERRVAASLVVLGYAARLVGPTIAVMLRDGILLDVRMPQVRYSYEPELGFRLAIPEPAGWRAAPAALHQQWCRDVVDSHLNALINAVRVVAPAAAAMLWGNVASSVAGALRSLTQAGAAPVEACHTTGTALLDCPPLHGSGKLSVHNGQLWFVRRSCCLFYRLEGGGMCGDCPLVQP